MPWFLPSFSIRLSIIFFTSQSRPNNAFAANRFLLESPDSQYVDKQSAGGGCASFSVVVIADKKNNKIPGLQCWNYNTTQSLWSLNYNEHSNFLGHENENHQHVKTSWRHWYTLLCMHCQKWRIVKHCQGHYHISFINLKPGYQHTLNPAFHLITSNLLPINLKVRVLQQLLCFIILITMHNASLPVTQFPRMKNSELVHFHKVWLIIDTSPHI